MIKRLFVLFAAAAFALTSCDDLLGGGDDDDGKDDEKKEEPGGDPSGDPGGNGLTADENKQKIERIAAEFAELINPVEFDDLVSALETLSGDGGIGSPFGDEKEDPINVDAPDPVNRAGRAATALMGRFGFINTISTRAVDFAASDLYGTYTYNGTEWVETENSDELKIAYQSNGYPIVISIKASDNTTDVTVETITSNEVRNEDGSIHHLEEIETLTAAVPDHVTFTMTRGSATLIDMEISIPSIAADATAADIITATQICGYEIASTVRVNPTSASAMVVMKKGATTMLEVEVIGSGSRLTSYEFVRDESVSGEDYYAKFLADVGAVTSTVTILGGKAYVKGSSANLQPFIDGLKPLDDAWDENRNQESAPIYAAGLTELVRDHMTIFMNYDNSNEAVATYEYKRIAKNDDFNGDGQSDWGTVEDSNLVFAVDGSKVKMSDYFVKSNFQRAFDLMDDFADFFERISYRESDEPEQGEVHPNPRP